MKNTTPILIAFAFLTILKLHTAHQFQVGGDKGWVIPPSNDTDHYNQWATHNRFSINDTLRFEYKKDSVLVVTKEEHEKCKSSHPLFFSDNGDTSFELNRSGFFYFISGDSGHCERGLKMIVKVLEAENNVGHPANHTSTTTTTTSEAASVLKMDSDTLSQTLMIVGIIAMFTVFYM
ncbi:putative Phytocyanin domain, cupredoxin [Helianthus annuus]|uniref:Phytocyanin domain, cupredoxin n=1 Tax=Helianthus annuus TaxID=4232 RepID=A0A251TZX8_HELAN|nr:early nodulin-like protein 1 [Helianthus annuus]KAF5792596.1 putative Phytocyanin domain, cupredoxin [Helianthus annuus]KAJ0527527.1 putative Phytocyanin domain, cupredoxin [Helianthus annuus]KAJ0536258.1 putative Phytocyanin domain, cupredoxin [Helianthus annuus]KAJ0543934.1 putative Phytocyanin domain, cupredoxin [Helianthus annuus]KAJ0708990.1 putative Phytocyanin domain, cupredoxin [Helianthus annuus]